MKKTKLISIAALSSIVVAAAPVITLVSCTQSLKVTFYLDGGTIPGLIDNAMTVTKGTTYGCLPVPTKTNAVFTGYEKDGIAVLPEDTIEGNVHLMATWDEIPTPEQQIFLSISTSNGGVVAPKTLIIYRGETFGEIKNQIELSPEKGYYLDKFVLADDEEKVIGDDYVFDTDTPIKAIFAKETLDIELSKDIIDVTPGIENEKLATLKVIYNCGEGSIDVTQITNFTYTLSRRGFTIDNSVSPAILKYDGTSLALPTLPFIVQARYDDLTSNLNTTIVVNHSEDELLIDGGTKDIIANANESGSDNQELKVTYGDDDVTDDASLYVIDKDGQSAGPEGISIQDKKISWSKYYSGDSEIEFRILAIYSPVGEAIPKIIKSEIYKISFVKPKIIVENIPSTISVISGTVCNNLCKLTVLCKDKSGLNDVTEDATYTCTGVNDALTIEKGIVKYDGTTLNDAWYDINISISYNGLKFSKDLKLAVEHADPQNLFTFNIDADEQTATLSSYSGADKDVIIPSKYYYNDKIYPVTSIGFGAFAQNQQIETVTLPNTITNIGFRSFSESNIKSIVIPNSVENIERSAFNDCKNLETVLFAPDSKLIKIGPAAFSGCEKLTSFAIPDSVEIIGENAFDFCKSLIVVSIGKKVKTIGTSAFQVCSNLKTIDIPNSVETIGDYAFASCSSLTSVYIGKNVNRIGSFAFQACNRVTDTSTPGYMTNKCGFQFRGSAAQWCNISRGEKWHEKTEGDDNNCTLVQCAQTVIGLDDTVPPSPVDDFVIDMALSLGIAVVMEYNGPGGNVIIPSYIVDNWGDPCPVSAIFGFAFCKNQWLYGVTIPDTVLHIYPDAFEGCRFLRYVGLGKNVEYIGEKAFGYCTSLTDGSGPNGSYGFQYEGTMAQWKSIERSNNWHMNSYFWNVQCSDGVCGLDVTNSFEIVQTIVPSSKKEL